MREIKFRAWDKINKRFARTPIYAESEGGDLWADCDPFGIDMSGKRGIRIKDFQYEFAGEFTGLKDKNGKEIYEGDIVEMTVLGSHGEIKAKANELVKYEKCFFSPLHYHSTDYLEVIGNLYENPELLTPLEGKQR